MGAQRKEDFARTFQDEVRVLKVRMGSNKAGYFLEVAVFVEGGWKGVIRLLKGRGGWGWQIFMDELRILVAHLVEKALPMIAAVNAGEVGCASCSKLSVMEAQAPMSDVGSSLRSRWPSPNCSLEALRSLAMVRAEVDRVLFFGLGLKVDASSDVRRRMGWVFSRLG